MLAHSYHSYNRQKIGFSSHISLLLLLLLLYVFLDLFILLLFSFSAILLVATMTGVLQAITHKCAAAAVVVVILLLFRPSASPILLHASRSLH